MNQKKIGPIIILERFIIVPISVFIVILLLLKNFRLDSLKDYKSLFANTISFSSILLGVLLTLVGLLLGYANKNVIKRIRSRNANGLLVDYFVFPIISGFIIVVSSLVLGNIFEQQIISNLIYLKIISSTWIFFVAYFILATLRITSLMLIILKEVFYEDVTEEENPKKRILSNCEFKNEDF